MRISGCRLKEKTQDRLAEFFVGGVTARSAADLARVNRRTGAYFFHRLRQIIAWQLEDSLPVEGLVEVDESHFGGVRKGKRGRGAAGKIPVFGILKRGGKVHTMMIPDVRKDTLLPIIRHKVVPDSIVYSDSYPAYDVLDVSEFHATGTCEPSNAGPNLRPSQPNLGRPQRKITVRLPLVCLKATAVTTPSRRERPSARSSRFEGHVRQCGVIFGCS